MSPAAVIAVAVVAAIVIGAILFVALAPARRRRAAARLESRRAAAAAGHREAAESKLARARIAEQQSATARAEADLHTAQAALLERGLADDAIATAPHLARRPDEPGALTTNTLTIQ
jgi:hypothetical protein